MIFYSRWYYSISLSFLRSSCLSRFLFYSIYFSRPLFPHNRKLNKKSPSSLNTTSFVFEWIKKNTSSDFIFQKILKYKFPTLQNTICNWSQRSNYSVQTDRQLTILQWNSKPLIYTHTPVSAHRRDSLSLHLCGMKSKKKHRNRPVERHPRERHKEKETDTNRERSRVLIERVKDAIVSESRSCVWYTMRTASLTPLMALW